MPERDIMHISNEFFSVQDVGSVFNLFLHLIMYFVYDFMTNKYAVMRGHYVQQ